MLKYVTLCALLFATPVMAESGVASYYGGSDGLCGHKMANGQRLNCSAMTAAHKSLPFGTQVRVTHGNKSIVVTITDRGPYIRGRVLDLNIAAARSLGMGGTAHVQYEIIGGTNVQESARVSYNQGRGHRHHRRVRR
jgi:rare lipoprotein A